MIDNPKVSVIIPTKNREKSIVRSLNSVVNQSIKPFEIIVIDDGSNDNTAKVIKEKFPQVKLIHNQFSKGGAIARNQGSDLATGDYLAFLDSDDEWLSDHLLCKVQLLKDNNVEGAFGTFILVKGDNKVSIHFGSKLDNNLNIGNAILSPVRFDTRTSTFVFKRDAFLTIKFDEVLKKHQDWDLAINFDEKFNWVCDRNPTVKILVEQGEERMSSKLQHKSSFYFLEKNQGFLKSDNVFIFCLKQIMRSQIAKEPKEIITKYLAFSEPLLPELSFKNQVLFFLVKYKLLNMGYAYKVLSNFR